MLEQKIKDMSKTTKMWQRAFTKVILGEFNRVNDGKPITDEQCVSVIKKLVKNSKEIIKLRGSDENAERELEFLKQFLPKEASELEMREAVDASIQATPNYKNIMQLMKPCINLLEEKGLDVNKGALSKLLKSY